MAEKTQAALSADAARLVVKRAQQKVLARDAARVLVGIRKTARGASCPFSKAKGVGNPPPPGQKPDADIEGLPEALQGKAYKVKKKVPKPGFPKASVLRVAVAHLRLTKRAKKRQAFVKAAAVAIVTIKHGSEMQKQAAIAELLKMIAGKGAGGLGKILSGLGGKLPGKALPGMLSPGKAPGILSRLGAGAGAGLRRGGKAVSEFAGRIQQPLSSAESVGRAAQPALDRLLSNLRMPGLVSPGQSAGWLSSPPLGVGQMLASRSAR